MIFLIHSLFNSQFLLFSIFLFFNYYYYYYYYYYYIFIYFLIFIFIFFIFFLSFLSSLSSLFLPSSNYPTYSLSPSSHTPHSHGHTLCPLIGMATGRVWDGLPLSHSRPKIYNYFPSSSQTRCGARFMVPFPFSNNH